MTRDGTLKTFLAGAGWQDAERKALAGDASTRRYERLSRPGTGTTAILMDAPPAAGNDTAPFVHIARHLAELNLSAPAILAEDGANGFLLLEDLGDALFARLSETDAQMERVLYRAATDLLLDLHRHAVPRGLPVFGPHDMARATDLALLWYAKGCGQHVSAHEVATCERLVGQALSVLPSEPPVLALRDYHAENLIWLPNRSGPAQVGLLDFQDAFAGPRAYDLVSLLEDARRDVPSAVRDEMIAHYSAGSGYDEAVFRTSYATLGAQRNLRILGVFARLCMHFGKAQYVDLIPRVWAHLESDLTHPALAELARFLTQTLPAPTPERLERIRRRCGTCPMP